MVTTAKQLTIRDFVAELRKFSESALDQTGQIRRFLQDTPLAPDPTRDRP